MKAFCECCGKEVEVLFRRNWRFSASPVPCPQFRKHLCMECRGTISDAALEKAKSGAKEGRRDSSK
jgi:hypothetical protein